MSLCCQWFLLCSHYLEKCNTIIYGVIWVLSMGFVRQHFNLSKQRDVLNVFLFNEEWTFHSV